jgi:hypothetical protein
VIVNINVFRVLDRGRGSEQHSRDLTCATSRFGELDQSCPPLKMMVVITDIFGFCR